MRIAYRSTTSVLFILGSAVGLLLAFGILWVGSVDFAIIWVLAIGLILLGCLPIWADWVRGKLDLFNLRNLFLGYYVLQFGVWAVWIVATGETKFLSSVAAWKIELQLALVYAILGLIAFFMGYRARIGLAIARRLPYFSVQWDSFRLAILTAGLLVLGIYSFYHIISDWGGLWEYVGELGSARLQGIRGKGYFLLMAWFFPTVSLLIFYSKALETRLKVYYTLSILVSLVVVFIGASLGFRAFLILPFLQVLCFRHYLRRRLRFQLKFLAIILPLAMLINIYSYYRDIPLRDLESDVVVSTLMDTEFWLGSGERLLRRFSGIETLTLVVDRTQTFEYGRDSLLYLLTFPVPRALWPEKPTPINTFLVTVYEESMQYIEGANTTLPGELYWNFHVPGIVFGLFLAGLFCKIFYKYLTLHPNKSTVLLYAIPLANILWVVEAPTLGIASFISMIGVTLVVLLVLTGFRLQNIRR